jgi:SPP1 family predicted phage head-tail adaptor
MPIQAGLLNEIVKLQRAAEDADDSGQVKKRWLDVEEVWARALPLGGRNEFGDQQFVATGDVRFTIRRRDDVNPLFRIVYRGQEYEIVSVAPDGLDLLLVVARARKESR